MNLIWHRFGYDFVGGYDREISGRPGYADERPHGRYIGRSSTGYGPPGNSPFELLNFYYHLVLGYHNVL